MDIIDPITYRGYRIINGASCQLAIMYGNEALSFADDVAEAKATIDDWLDAP